MSSTLVAPRRPKLEKPWEVTAENGEVLVFVMDPRHDQVPNAFALMATTVAEKVALRFTGGCANMSRADKDALISYFEAAFGGKYGGLLFSGATREATAEGEIDPMICDVPAFLAAANPGSKALGTAPRTGQMRLVQDSRFELHRGTGINPGQAAVVIVQYGPETPAGWDGDLDTYFGLLANLKEHAAFTSVGTIAYNGGGVTGKEIMASAKRGWPTILIKGSGRKCDEILTKLEAGDAELLKELPTNHQLTVVNKDRPEELTTALVKHGFISA